MPPSKRSSGVPKKAEIGTISKQSSEKPAQAPRTRQQAAQWEKDLRKQIRQVNGRGWSVRLPKGKNNIQVQWEFGSRSDRQYANLPADVEWSSHNSLEICNIIKGVHDIINGKNLNLKDAIEMLFRQENPASSSRNKSLSIEGWQKAADSYIDWYKSNNRSTSWPNVIRSVTRTVDALKSRPMPTTGKEVLERHSQLHWHHPDGSVKTALGGQGRKRGYEESARFLKYAVNEAGAPNRYLPPDDPKGEFKQKLVGRAPLDKRQKKTIPLKPEQFSDFLDWLEANNMPELHLAVGIVGYYGLRECELAVLYPSEDGGPLYVGNHCKENWRQRSIGKKHSDRPPRLVHHLAVKGRPVDEAKELIRKYQSGEVQFPEPIKDAIDNVMDAYKQVGIKFSAEVKKTQFWKDLVAQEPQLAVNSLRHGWAYRAHCTKGAWLDFADAAEFMGHDKITHINHYASWTNEAKKLESAEAFNAAIAAA